MIYIILLNFNGTQDTIECLESLFELQQSDVRIIVVDNASRDPALATIAHWANARASDLAVFVTSEAIAAGAGATHCLSLVQNPDNLGFAAGNNVGIRLALNDPDCTYVWLVNNDTVVAPDSLTHLLDRSAEDDAIGICGSTLIYYDDRDVVQAIGGAFNKRTGRARQIGSHASVDALPARDALEQDMDYVAGASMLVTRRFLEKVGLLNERYFLYYEEIDWSTRGQPVFKLGWAPKSHVFHKEGAAIGTSSRGRPSITSLYYMTNSNLRFMWAYHPTFILLSLVRHGVIAIRYAVKADLPAARVTAKAVGDFLTGKTRRGPL
ncbi:glycosyltransferase family 2 protein [Sphingobium sp. H39-3-25]|uniref:glycosyltransferase family 2 protein n=1 Tax=Sphingobium arseniciresistens TaxID=3030834 RepID=UPI0023B9BF51|nr:glycosyltransferase family 2 protein [Sphingobium arseniciresistens]